VQLTWLGLLAEYNQIFIMILQQVKGLENSAGRTGGLGS